MPRRHVSARDERAIRERDPAARWLASNDPDAEREAEARLAEAKRQSNEQLRRAAARRRLQRDIAEAVKCSRRP